MKILVQGVRQDKPLPAWVGRRVECPWCHSVLLLEDDDLSVRITLQARCINGPITVEVFCPVCLERMEKTFCPNDPKDKAI